MITSTFARSVISFTILSCIFGAAIGIALSPADIEKGKSTRPYDSELIGDVDQAGVVETKLDDRYLAHVGGKKRRLVKIQLWCDGKKGPISMIPWYNDHNGLTGDSKHWTWGLQKPFGR